MILSVVELGRCLENAFEDIPDDIDADIEKSHKEPESCDASVSNG